MKPFDDAAYTMAAVSAVVALYRVLVKNGVLTRDEAVRTLLDEAVSRAIQAEAQQQGEAAAHDVNRQCAEILKFIAEKALESHPEVRRLFGSSEIVIQSEAISLPTVQRAGIPPGFVEELPASSRRRPIRRSSVA